MNQINIIPKIIHDKFAARIIMDDYDIEKPIVITVVARRNDGEYNTQILTYPTSGVDYEGNVRMVFFDVARSHVCQITSVFINGHEVKTYYTDIPDLDMQARYDDSLCRYDKKVNMNDIRLSFQVLETRDPKVLQVLDESEWGLLEDRKAIIEITTPGMSDPVTLFLGKNQVNTFTSLTLGLNCFNYDDCNVKYLDLPDGIYDIKIIGSPSTYNFSRKYLKTDLIRRRLDRLWAWGAWIRKKENSNRILSTFKKKRKMRKKIVAGNCKRLPTTKPSIICPKYLRYFFTYPKRKRKDRFSFMFSSFCIL